MTLIERDGWWWPASDELCHRINPPEVALLDEMLPWVPGRDVCVHAGGNTGIWAKRLAQEFGWVWVYEPDSENAECFRRNVTADNVALRQAALGQYSAKVGLAGDRKNMGALHVSGEGDVPLYMLDKLSLDALDFLHLDIEGMEVDALMGATHTIARCRPVIAIEVYDEHLARYGRTRQDIEAWAYLHRYRVVKVFQHDLLMVPM